MTNTKNELFAQKPVPIAVLTLVVPTVISQLIIVLYSMADTFFVGQSGDPNQVAAVHLCMPMLSLLNGFANLFGIGGSSLISRCLGAGDSEKAKHAASFSIWTSIFVSFCYGIAIYLFRPVLLPAFGANEGTYEFCSQYIFWTICVGAIPTVLSTEFAHLVRAEGFAKQASYGMMIGAGLNIILDPIFITVLDMQIAGAALATMLSNLTSLAYFLHHLIRRQQNTTILLHPKYYTLSGHIPFEILFTGLPSALMSLLGTFSNITLNKLMASYCNEAIAGVGIAKKIDMLTYGIAIGMSQGVVPLIGYNFSSGNFSRMRKAIKTTLMLSLSVTIASAIFLFVCAHPIVKSFINDAATVGYGQRFQRIICITGPCISVTMIVITVFQSVGKKVQPLLLSLFRKGGLDIPFMFLMNTLLGVNGIVWATPIADIGAMVIAVILFVPFWRKLVGYQAFPLQGNNKRRLSLIEKYTHSGHR
jgi:multidrug efflux pump